MLVRSLFVFAALVAGSAHESTACRPSGKMVRLPDLPEASGLAASRAHEGRLWAHNDSGAPILHAIESGRIAGRVTIEGARVEDWEALAIGPCPSGTCLYIGDIGDNDAKRASITIYRVPEPGKAAGTARADGVFTASYPDGRHDAETLLIGPDGRLFIVTKGETGPAALYRFPAELRAGQPMKLERIGKPLAAQLAQAERITDGAISPDGESVALRSRASITFYGADDFLRGTFKEQRRVDLKPFGEPQGEAVAFGANDTVFLGGEGGGKKQAGTLLVLSCPQ